MYRKTVLQNGVRIISEKLDHFRSVSLGIWVGAGSRDEVEKKSGISHFIEHMIFKKTNSRSGFQIAKELDAIGGLSNAFTAKEYTCFHSKVLDEDFSHLADILSDIFLNSVFDPHDLDRERQVILQEINMVEDTPDEYVHVLFNREFWSNHPLGMPVLGTGESVSSIHRDTILNHMKRFYTPGRIVIAAAGSVDHDAVVAYLQPLFDLLPTANDEPSRDAPPIKGGVSCHDKDLEQVHICLGGKAPELSSELRFAGAILNTILGGNMSSRLFQEIREKRGLAYSVFSFLSAYLDTGLLGVYVATDPQEQNHALEVIHNEIKKIQKGEVTRSDLVAAQKHLIGGVLLGSESTDTRMMRLAKNEFVFDRYVSYDELIAKLEKVEIDEVVSVAEDTFRNNKVSLVTLGPTRCEDLDLAHLQFD